MNHEVSLGTSNGYWSNEPESFLVEDAEGPLAAGELERAREWGSVIAAQLRTAVQETAE